MNDSNRLGQMILKRWQTHHPKMLAQLIAALQRLVACGQLRFDCVFAVI
ncbi:MAG: hypothetical protein WBQ86_21290 [Candidatus Binatus sp.]